MATSVQDALIQLIKLTQTNLEILQGINDSFLTTSLTVTVSTEDEGSYVIPSFLSLENKLNALQEDFDNLVQGAKCGEVWMNLDGSSRVLAVRSYQSAPIELDLDPSLSTFESENNYIFKDFLSPKPYITFLVQDLPNDITEVLIKKVIPKSDTLKEIFASYLGGESSTTIAVEQTWADLYKVLSIYKEGTDYEVYDTRQYLPIRQNVGTGSYVIKEITSDTVSEDLEEFITLTIRTDVESPYLSTLYYTLFDGTISKALAVGDRLTTWDGSAMLEIESISSSSATLTLKVLNDEYLNLTTSDEGDTEISDYAVLRFFSPADFDDDKYVKVTLEEDQYIFTAIAGLNSRLNVQAGWGTGLIINTYLLTNGDGTLYENYYTSVSNIGDLLYDITAMFSSESVTHLSQDEYDSIKNLSPSTDYFNLSVIQVNSHLDNSETVKTIRTAYAEKKILETQLSELNSKIDEITAILAEISFSDTSGQRTIYTSQLSEYNTQKTELEASITTAIDEISQAANNSTIPIENAKYRIRGYYDISPYTDDMTIKDIEVWYRYKNLDESTGTATTIGDDGFIFSDWNVYSGPKNYRTGILEDGSWTWSLNENSPEDDILINVPHFNQIDIPITQGETVDIRVRFIYEMGQPFVEIKSGWSEILNVEFPDEYLQNVEVLDIIEENNNDITTNKFNNILDEVGITDHIDDSIVDQDITYFHNPENISSGFYTSERRIIPLKDKLESMDLDITSILDIVNGTSATAFTVTISNGDTSYTLTPYLITNIVTPAYSSLSTDSDYISSGVYNINYFSNTESSTYTFISTYFNINITNNTEHSLRLFSMFPGDYTMSLNDMSESKMKFDKDDYTYTDSSSDYGIPLGYTDDSGNLTFETQKANQFITFRHTNAGTGESFYNISDILTSTALNAFYNEDEAENITLSTYTSEPSSSMMTALPYLSSQYSLALYQDTSSKYITIASSETVTIPILVEVYIDSSTDETTMQRMIGFDLRPSLYEDPIPYFFKIICKNNNTSNDLISISSKTQLKTTLVKYNTTVK